MPTVTDRTPGLSLRVRSEGAHVIAALTGELDIASAPALREQLLNVLRPAVSRLIVDLSAVSYADATGLAVLVGTGRRAGLLGGFLRLAAPAPAVTGVLRRTGLYWQFDIFPSVRAAIAGAPAVRLADPADARLTALGAVAAQRQPA
ncbi:MAG TPA: STAS domain-containing protein [Streptosporangiaceae bacterium]|jgi:anti-sigma B factor antagonist